MPSTDQAEQTQRNMSLYLAPEQLTANEANEKARPAERPEQRAARVKSMAESIAMNGQEYPVLIVEVESDVVTTYEYVDGGCRVEAIGALNDQNGQDPRTVWCSVVDPNTDLFKQAIVANLHRTQNSLLDMAHIVMEALERNGWKGRGTGKKVAAYLGIQESRVSEYEKLLRAPSVLKSKIESGEVASLDAALKLMDVPEADIERVTARASEIAEEEEAARPPKKGKREKVERVPPTAEQKAAFRSVKEAAKHDREEKAKVKAKHVVEAAREVSGQASPRAKSEVAEFFEAVTEAAYPKAAVAFADYFAAKWMRGEGTDRHARELFDAAVGLRAAKGKVKTAAKAKAKSAPAKKAAGAKKKK